MNNFLVLQDQSLMNASEFELRNFGNCLMLQEVLTNLFDHFLGDFWKIFDCIINEINEELLKTT